MRKFLLPVLDMPLRVWGSVHVLARPHTSTGHLLFRWVIICILFLFSYHFTYLPPWAPLNLVNIPILASQHSTPSRIPLLVLWAISARNNGRYCSPPPLTGPTQTIIPSHFLFAGTSLKVYKICQRNCALMSPCSTKSSLPSWRDCLIHAN